MKHVLLKIGAFCTAAIGVQSIASAGETVHTLVEVGAPDLTLHQYRAAPRCGQDKGHILFLHGATFPANLSIGFKIDGKSWADDLNTACYSVWALNFAGYGGSASYTKENRPSDADTIPGRTPEVQAQIMRAANFIQEKTGHSKVAIIAHSWGTIPAGAFAANNPERVSALLLFGPIAARPGALTLDDLTPTRVVTIDDQHAKFVQDTPPDHAPVLDETAFGKWAARYLATDPASGTRDPGAVEVPSGPIADVRMAWSGKYPYDPAALQTRTLVLRGAWDRFVTDRDANWFRNAFSNVTDFTDIKLPAGGHLMHLETGRDKVWQAARAFLARIVRDKHITGANEQ